MRLFKPILLLFVSFASFSCSLTSPGDDAEGAISRDTFVEVYVKLRMAALGVEGQELTIRARDKVLSEMGLTEDDVLKFVEVHGKDVQFMRRVWEEVDSTLTEQRLVANGERRDDL